ncbi:MAG TPA: right-handed parallel beta-helix repeat-containing protein, partial [Acidobacteriaceae bacterium]|nr:right-handed parallel beta-helix repeat-containing protein [Acidobacteriaceae bacterium]
SLAAKDGTASRCIDRRRFLQLAAGAAAIVPLGGSAFASAQPISQPEASASVAESRLPDGTEHAFWEQPLTFSKTYYVDNTSASADDHGPGSKTRPFRTISKAAEVLQPGERVVIAAGTYRECVRPVRGGSGPSQMISYEAAPGATVYIKGSEILKAGWQQESVSTRRFGPAAQEASPVTVWRHDLAGAMFPDAYNPFALASAPADRAWLDTRTVDMGPYFRRRGLVFVDGKPLEPVEQRRELASARLPGPPPPGQPVPLTGLPLRTRGGPIMQEIGGSPDARVWVDNSGEAITVRLANGTPAEHAIEITTREQVFVPAQEGLAWIRVKGITFQHAGNGYPIPQRGLLSTAGGNHWIIEDNTIEWANGVGMDIANGDWNAVPTPQAGTAHIIRRNTIRYCGVEGIAGMGTHDTLIEDNLIEWCGWADAERAWEAAGAKFHGARNLLFRRNVVRHIRHANGIWLDSRNANCRISSNVFADVLTVSAAVHMEMNLDPNQIDNNIIWDVRNAEPGTPGQRGCAGSGVFINASDRLIIAQNLIGRCDNSGVFAITRPDRANSGTALNNQIDNNIFARCGKSAIVFLNQNNEADGNLYVSMPNDFLGYFQGDSKQFLDLTDWRSTHGWDKDSSAGDVQIAFNPDTLELTINSTQPLPKPNAVHQINCDMLGKLTGEKRAPGPLADPGAKNSWHADPRAMA